LSHIPEHTLCLFVIAYGSAPYALDAPTGGAEENYGVNARQGWSVWDGDGG